MLLYNGQIELVWGCFPGKEPCDPFTFVFCSVFLVKNSSPTFLRKEIG